VEIGFCLSVTPAQIQVTSSGEPDVIQTHDSSGSHIGGNLWKSFGVLEFVPMRLRPCVGVLSIFVLISAAAVCARARTQDEAKADKGNGSAKIAAQQGAKIIAQYVKSAGGARALGRIQTLSIQGTVTRAENTSGTGSEANAGADASNLNSGTYTFDTKEPNRYYSEIVYGGKHLMEAYNGKSAWHEDASGNPVTMVSDDALETQFEAQIANTHLLDLKKNHLYVAFVGHATVSGKDALQVEVMSASRVKRELFFDPQTRLLVKESRTTGSTPEQIFFSDFRLESGVQIARKIELHRGADVYAIELTSATINQPLGERVFDLPLSSQVKLPDLKTLFKEIDDNQKAIDKIKENYAGTRTEEETQLDSNGKVKKHTVDEYSFFYFDGEEISTMTKKDDKALSDDEEKTEIEKANKRVEEIKKRHEKKAKEEGKQKKDDDEVGIETFLRTCEFVNPRRERFRGQDVLAFDFEGNPEYKPRNLEERIVQKLAGVVWVDEKAHDVARLEAYFVGDAKIADGLLATIQKGTGFVFEQEYVNNEVWLPTYEEAHGGVRLLLVKGFRINEVTRYSDYKKYHVEASAVVSNPKQ